MKKYSILEMRKIAVISLCIYTVIYYVLLAFFSSTQSGFRQPCSDLLTLVGEAVGFFIIVWGMRCQKVENKVVWLLFLIGISLNFIGDFIWSLYEVILKKEISDPSLCDIFYLAAQLYFLLAILFYIQQKGFFDAVRTGFDILITMVISTTIVFKYIMLPIWGDATLTVVQKLISLAYPIFDLGYMGGILSLFFLSSSKSKLNHAGKFLGVAFLLWFSADMIYATYSQNAYVSGGYTDPLWPIGCWVLALAVLYPAKEGALEEQSFYAELSKCQKIIEYIRLLFPYLSVFIIVVLVSMRYILEDPLVAGTVVAALLIMVRQIFSLIENKHLISIIQKSNHILEEDNAQLEEQNSKLQELKDIKENEANTDFLTKLFNRRYINRALKELYKKAVIQKTMQISILLIDIDYYKQVNDKWGHNVGDAVLQKIANLIKNSIRTNDIAGRYGGDEFIAILPETDLISASNIAKRLIQKTSDQEFMENERIFGVTLSIGCAHWRGTPQDYDVHNIIVAADRALYQAKESGRNQYQSVEVTGSSKDD